MKEQYLEVRLPKCLVVLTKGELLTLLRQDPDLWQKALQRGKAAMALWEYSENSCKYIFGGSTSEPTEAEILGALEQGSMTQSEIYHLFDGNTPAYEYKNALTNLYRQGLITYEERKPKSKKGGRPAIVWSIINKDAT